MNEETNTPPETLAAILAEMRADVADGENAFFIRADWLALCDRIEAAAKRDTQNAMKTAFMAKCEVCEKLSPARPGNAAALREALEKVHKAFCDGLIGAHCIATDAEAEALFRLWHTEIPAALAAPARNCDRFATVGAAHKAWRATDQERDFADWLFDKAEGGDHA